MSLIYIDFQMMTSNLFIRCYQIIISKKYNVNYKGNYKSNDFRYIGTFQSLPFYMLLLFNSFKENKEIQLE
jgi:hypothetical protein